jgi:hypothetical protein
MSHPQIERRAVVSQIRMPLITIPDVAVITIFRVRQHDVDTTKTHRRAPNPSSHTGLRLLNHRELRTNPS